jgi:DNA repair exonuclease SbcCD ATPase subunit
MNLELEINNLQNNLDILSGKVSRLEGERSLLARQITESQAKSVALEANRVTENKAVELLHVIQHTTRDKIVEAFENIVSSALTAIYKEEYRFKLEFSQRGNSGELDFKLKSPTTEGYLDLKDTAAGGQMDILGLALRFMLLHIIYPRLNGPILLDEPTKQLSSNFRTAEYEFYYTMAKKFNRQILIVTHSKELSELAENKVIIGNI